MEIGIFVTIAILQVATLAGLIFGGVGLKESSGDTELKKLRHSAEELGTLTSKYEELYANMVDLNQMRVKAKELKLLRDSLKTERGRITITQAELETVETRLRELEEIERELEASSLETKEELGILQKKQAELNEKNAALKAQIEASSEQMQQLMGELQLSAELTAQIQRMQTELLSSQEKVDTLSLNIEQGNEQYFILKKRYDALDIEYAQLFEKFSAAEEMMNKGK
jgi:chromosome segregation ATPase